MTRIALAKTLMILTVVLAPLDAAHAYVGPGLGVGTLAVILGVIGSILIAVFAILWYPIKRMFKKRKAVEADAEHSPEA